MEKLRDIFNNIKDRFSNPLIFSFVCSWLIINWQITVGLLWYDTEQIEKTSCPTIFEFIKDKLNVQEGFLHPFYFALAYTLIMPLIRNCIRVFYTWTAKWGDNWNLKISKGIKIPFEKYLKFREDYDKRSKILEEVIEKENEYAEKYNSMNTELLQSRSTINDLMQKQTESSNFLQQLYDVRILNGYWTNKYADTIDKTLIGSEEVYIQDGRYHIVEKFSEKKHTFNITNFFFDNRNKTIVFTKERINHDKQVITSGGVTTLRFNINVLRVEREDLLVGIENGTTQIEYLKKPITPSIPKGEKEK